LSIGCCCNKSTSCSSCNWFCGNPNPSAYPQYIDVIDPVYGKFRLFASGCQYSLDTYLSFGGNGSCPPCSVPVRFVVGAGLSSDGQLDIIINDQGFDFDCAPTDGVIQTNCQTTYHSQCWPIYGTNYYVNCPNNNLTFPVPAANVGLEGTVLGASFNCNSPLNTTASTALRLLPIDNGAVIYLLWAQQCPATENAIPLQWQITAGPFASGSCPANCCQTPCNNCQFPTKDLQLSYTNLITGNGSTTLYYSPVFPVRWTSECYQGLIFKLLCTDNEPELRVIYFTEGSCPNGEQQYCSNVRLTPYGLTLGSFQCNPFNVNYTAQSDSCPAIVGAGYTSFQISDSNPAPNPPGLMCQQFCVASCLGSIPIPELTLNVYSYQGGSGLGSVTFDQGSECAWASWTGGPGSYYIEIDGAGGVCASGTYSLTCGGTTNIPVDAGCECFSGEYPDGLFVTLDGFIYVPTNGTWINCNVSFDLVNAGVAAGGSPNGDFYGCPGESSPECEEFGLTGFGCLSITFDGCTVSVGESVYSCGIYQFDNTSSCDPLDITITIPQSNPCFTFGGSAGFYGVFTITSL
jgi:hypothetical protein